MPHLNRHLHGDLDAPGSFTLLQWNVLADRLAFGNFVRAPDACLTWDGRGERIVGLLADGLPELPDVICLQEVDHFPFIAERLEALAYAGVFAPKQEGRDGCALFAQTDRFSLEDVRTLRYHDAAGAPHSQLALHARVVPVHGGTPVHVVTTHLKAKEGYEELRATQGRQLLESLPHRVPVIVAGDFNDVPGSLVHQAMTQRLASSYASILGDEPAWTTWKVRDHGEKKRTIDYIWHSDQLRALSCLAIPADEDVDAGRLPSWQYPSDHLSLAVRFLV